MGLPVYLDNHSTTQLDPRVFDVMRPYLTEHFGNAASQGHAYGWTAEAAVDLARERVATLIGGRTNEIVLTSGATESNNLALLGCARANSGQGRHMVTLATEHKSVLDCAAHLATEGMEVTRVVPPPSGLVSPDDVAQVVRDDTVLVSVMHGNNEVGVVQPVAAIASAVKARNPGCAVHCDAAQSAATLPIDVDAWGIDLLSLSAHKMYGPMGIGALWVRRRPRVRLAPILHGGGHQQGLRAGTLPVPLAVGFGRACELARAQMAEDAARIGGLREALWSQVQAVGGVTQNGASTPRLPGNLNVSVSGVPGEGLLLALAKDVAVSSGAACSSATREPSYVLRALGVSDELAAASIRFGIGRFNTPQDVDTAAQAFRAAVTTLRD